MKKLILLFIFLIGILNANVIDWNPKYDGWLSIHNYSYFIFHPSGTKIQISAKYKIIQQLYGAYTAVMFWDLLGYSLPFTEISHNPELFYELKFFPGFIIDYIHFGIYEHKSNGRDDEKDRFFDRSYISFNLKYELIKNILNMKLRQKYFVFIDLQKTKWFGRYINNYPGTYDYYGWYEWELAVNLCLGPKFINKETIYIKFFNGGDKIFNEKFSYELGIRVQLVFANLFNIYPYIQWYNGYCDNMYEFDKRKNLVRFGVILN